MNIDEIISDSKKGRGIDAESAVKLFASSEILDYAETIRRSTFSNATSVTAELLCGKGNSNVDLQERALKLAANGHRRILLRVGNTGISLNEAVESMLSIKRKRDDMRQIILQLPSDFDEKQLSELKSLNSTIIFPADSDLSILAKSINIPDIGLFAHFRADNFLGTLETLLHRADEISPRIIFIEQDGEIPLDVFERICQILRISKPFTSLMLFADSLEFSKYANSFLISENESLDKLINKMIRKSMLPSFCTACHFECRTGECFTGDCSSGKMHNFCYLNAIVSLKEYLADFGTQDTRIVGTDMILKELYSIKNDTVRSLMVKVMKEIRSGSRGMRF